ncbi:hypothetical protein RLIN73S_00474 [Rhodanobacter lindaniclasticus]
MKPIALSALAGVLLILGFVPASQAVEILRWERLPLPVPLVVGQERVVFIDRNVRVGVPASVGDHLRVQSAGGAIYLRASEPIPPTRLQLQDVESGALILLDIAAEPAKDGQAPLEPVRIVEAEAPRSAMAAVQQVARTSRPMRPQTKSVPRRETPVSVVLTRHAAQNLYAPLRTVEPYHRHRARKPAPRPRAGHLAADAAGARAGIGRVALGRPVGDGRADSPTPPRVGSTSTRAPCRGTSWRRPSSTRTWGRPAPRPTPRCSTWSRAATAWPSRCCRR